MIMLDEQPSSDQVLCTCSSEVGIAVGVLILIEGFIAAIIVVICWLIMRYIATIIMHGKY